jgi:hypothetical protein
MDTAAKPVKGAFTIVVKKSVLGAKVINAQAGDLGMIRSGTASGPPIMAALNTLFTVLR